MSYSYYSFDCFLRILLYKENYWDYFIFWVELGYLLQDFCTIFITNLWNISNTIIQPNTQLKYQLAAIFVAIIVRPLDIS